MRKYRIRKFTRREGGEWHVLTQLLYVTLEELENAQRDSYYDNSARSRVGKVPSLPVAVHALFLDNNLVWNVVDGFR